MLSAPRPPSAGRIQHSPSWHRAGQGEELQPSSQPVPPASPQPRATDKDLATPSPPNRSGHASFSHTPLSLCISGSLRQPAQLRAALPAAGRQLRAQRGSGQPPRGSVREGTAPLRSARNRGGPAHPGLGSTALLSAELLRAPLPARTRSGTGTETPRSHRTNGPGWRPQQRGIRAAAAGNLCAQVAGEAAPIPGCQQRVEKLRSPPAQSPSARAAPPSLAAGRPAAPPQPSFRRGSANGPAALRSGPASPPRSPPSQLSARSRRGRPYTAPLGRSAAAPGVYRARGPPRPARPSASGQSRPRSAWGSVARPCAAPPGCEGSCVACAAPAPAAAGQCRAPVVARPAACPRHGLWPAA